jgi:PAS domain S-box-containing protein
MHIVGTFLRAALEQTGAQRVLLILPDTSEPRIAAEATQRHNRIDVHLHSEVANGSRLPSSVLHSLLQSRRCIVAEDTAALSKLAPHSYIRQPKVGSILCLPLLHQGRHIGALLLESGSQIGVFTPRRISTLKLIASLAASALENSRLYRDSREREVKMGRLVNANIIGIYTIDLRGPILESNDAYLRMLGYNRADLISGGLRWTDLTPPEWHNADKRRVEIVKRIGHLNPFEKEYFRKDGTRVPVMVGVARFKKSRNQAMVFALDITKQKLAEATVLETRAIQQTRIARKVHDDLLQNFQGMMFQFQAARNLMEKHPDEAFLSLTEAIKDGQTALDESRDANRGFTLGLQRRA